MKRSRIWAAAAYIFLSTLKYVLLSMYLLSGYIIKLNIKLKKYKYGNCSWL